MGDNVTTAAGDVASDFISGAHYQRIKVTFGDDGTATDVSSVNPLPVSLTGGATGLTDAQLRASAVPVSGTFYQATQPISGTVSVSGSVAVTGSFYQATQPVSGTVAATQSGTWNIGSVTTLPALPANQSVNVAQINAVTPLMGNGVTGTGSQRVTIASDNTAFPVTVTNATAANLLATTTPTLITAARINSAASTNATAIRASTGTLFNVVCCNAGAAAAFVKIYNKASAPTVGTDVPTMTIPVPASSVVTVSYGALGMRYSTGIAAAITNLVADSDTTAVAANQVKVEVSYT